MRINRNQWNNMSIVEKIDIFKKKYREGDSELIYNIRQYIVTERFHDDPQLLEDKIIYYEEVDLDKFAEEWVSNCDEHLRPIVHYELLSNEEIERSIAYGTDFIISHNIDYNIKSYDNILQLYGEKSIYYHEWGPYANFKEEDIHDDFFVCKCTHTKGKRNLNIVCPRCNTPVTQRDFSVDKFGYFKTKQKFITGVGFRMLSDILNSNTEVGILDYICGKRIDKESATVKHQHAIAKKYKDKYLYDIVEDLIYDTLEGSKIESKKESIEHFLKNKDRYFLNYIPILSTAFRRMTYSSSFGVEHFEAHNDLNHILTSLSISLMNMDMYMNTKAGYKYYYMATKYINEMFQAVFDLAAGNKWKYLRSCVMGLRQNNVVMAVLEPLYRGMKEDTCIVNYRYLLALYSQEIETYLIYEKKMKPSRAYLLLNLNTDLTQEEKHLLHEFLMNNTCIVEYNRQPTIRLQSSIPLTIVGLTDAPVIYVHPTTCKKPNADHDGDAPSLKAITLQEGLAYKFYWRMGVQNYCLNYDGSFLGESMPYNDIAIAIKASIPSNMCKDFYKVKLGVRSQIIMNDEGILIDKEYVSNIDSVRTDNVSYSSIKQYEENIESIFYAV